MAKVGIVMGSDSDLPVMSKAAQILQVSRKIEIIFLKIFCTGIKRYRSENLRLEQIGSLMRWHESMGFRRNCPF